MGNGENVLLFRSGTLNMPKLENNVRQQHRLTARSGHVTISPVQASYSLAGHAGQWSAIRIGSELKHYYNNYDNNNNYYNYNNNDNYDNFLGDKNRNIARNKQQLTLISLVAYNFYRVLNMFSCPLQKTYRTGMKRVQTQSRFFSQ